MKTYIVTRPEVHYAYLEIEAESPEEAIEKVKEGGGDVVLTEYSNILEEDEPKGIIYEAREKEE